MSISLGLVVVFTRLLEAEEWGIYSFAKRIATIGSIITLMGLSVALPRYIPMMRNKAPHADVPYRSNAVWLLILSSSAITVLWFGAVFTVGIQLVGDTKTVYAFYAGGLYLLTLAWLELFNSMLRADHHYRDFNRLGVVNQLLQLVFGTALLLFIGRSASLALVGSALGLSTAIIVSLYLIRLHGIRLFRWHHIDKDVRSSLLSYGAPRAPLSLLEELIVALPVIILGFLGEPIAAGLFAIANTIIIICVSVYRPVSVIMLPEFSEKIGLNQFASAHRALELIVQGWWYSSTVMIVLLIAFADILIPVIFGADYRAAVDILYILLIGVLFLSFYIASYSYANALMKKPVIMYCQLAGLAVNAGLIFTMYPIFGSTGIAVAASFGMAVTGGMLAFILLKSDPALFSLLRGLDMLACGLPLAGILMVNIFLDLTLFNRIVLTIPWVVLYFAAIHYRKIEWYEYVKKYLRNDRTGRYKT